MTFVKVRVKSSGDFFGSLEKYKPETFTSLVSPLLFNTNNVMYILGVYWRVKKKKDPSNFIFFIFINYLLYIYIFSFIGVVGD